MADDPFSAPPFRGRVDLPYATSTVIGAAIATFLFPLLTLIAALMLAGNQENERRRAQLHLWAWASVAWIALQIAVGVIVVVSAREAGDAAAALLP